MELTNPFIEIGKRCGIQQGQSQLVIRQLTRRLGALSSSRIKVIRDLPPDKLGALGEALLDLTSSADLNKWLRSHKPQAGFFDPRLLSGSQRLVCRSA